MAAGSLAVSRDDGAASRVTIIGSREARGGRASLWGSRGGRDPAAEADTDAATGGVDPDPDPCADPAPPEDDPAPPEDVRLTFCLGPANWRRFCVLYAT